jgi:hypothetical protein
MLKGERVLAQSKRTAPPRQFQKISKRLFSIGIFEISIPLRNSISFGIYILRRSFSKLVSKIFDLLSFSQRKSIWNMGTKFQILKMLLKILLIYLWLFAKRLWKEFPKEFAKTKLVVQMWSKMLKIKSNLYT